MLKFSFIHAADLHLGRVFSGLPAFQCDEAIKIIKSAEERVINNIIETAISKKVDFVLISGDTFDDADKDFASKLMFKRMLDKLDENNIQVYAICGNHDPLYSYGRLTFNYDENSGIKIIGLNTPVHGNFPVFNNEDKKICVLHAISFEGNTYYGSPFQFFSRPGEQEKDLFNIALVHCDVNAAADGCYGPCNSQTIENLDYDYYALGHIHTPQNFGDKIFYSGTVQGRNPKETDAHGIRYIEVENKTAVKNEFIPVDIVRYEHITVDLSETQDITAAFDTVLNAVNFKQEQKEYIPELYIARVDLTGYIDFSENLNNEIYDIIAQKIYEYSSHKVLIEKITDYTKVKTDEELLNSDTGIIGEIMKTVNNENVLNDEFEKIFDNLSIVTSKYEYSPEEKAELKKQITNEAKEACINFCSFVYNKESKK